MSLTENKIRYLAEKLSEWLEARSDVRLLGTRDQVALEIRRVLNAAQEESAALDREVDAVLRQYQGQIAEQNADPAILRRRIKQELARKKGIVL